MSLPDEHGQPQEKASPAAPPDVECQSPVDYAAMASGIALTAVAAVLLVLHVVRLLHNGVFWRDECSSILLAQAPSWSEMWNHLGTDSFPGLFVSILRVWIRSGLGASDFGIGLLGILISLGLLLSVYLSCRAMQVRFPVLALCLIGLNSVVFYMGSSIRAYGLAALLIVACFAAFWRVAVQPTRWNAGMAFLLAVLSVHCNYHNSYLLFAIGVAAAAVAATERHWIRSVLILAMCFVAALSMLIYLPVIARYRSEIIVSMYQVSVDLIVDTLSKTLAANGYLLFLGWFAGIFTLLYVAVKQLTRPPAASDAPALTADPASLEANPASDDPASVADSSPGKPPAADLPAVAEPAVADIPVVAEPTASEASSPGFYCLLTVIIAAVAGTVFFKISAMYPFPWHYIPFVAVCAVAIECGIGSGKHGSPLWLVKLLLACYVAAVSLPVAWHAAVQRRTNMDHVAAELEKNAQPNDLILVNPYWLRPGFLKYYHGSAPWRIVPVDPDDVTTAWPASKLSIRSVMEKPDSIRPTLDLVEKTLRGGGKVWIVGNYVPLPPGEKPPKLIPAPHPDYGWDNREYTDVWTAHLSYFLSKHAEDPRTFVIQSHGPVDDIEDLAFFSFEGRHK